jgi:hypothetical protein
LWRASKSEIRISRSETNSKSECPRLQAPKLRRRAPTHSNFCTCVACRPIGIAPKKIFAAGEDSQPRVVQRGRAATKSRESSVARGEGREPSPEHANAAPSFRRRAPTSSDLCGCGKACGWVRPLTVVAVFGRPSVSKSGTVRRPCHNGGVGKNRSSRGSTDSCLPVRGHRRQARAMLEGALCCSAAGLLQRADSNQ